MTTSSIVTSGIPSISDADAAITRSLSLPYDNVIGTDGSVKNSDFLSGLDREEARERCCEYLQVCVCWHQYVEWELCSLFP